MFALTLDEARKFCAASLKGRSSVVDEVFFFGFRKNDIDQNALKENVDHYVVTGVGRDGKRFKIRTCSFMQMQMVNVWQGSKWKVVDGKRKLLQRVYN